MNAVQQREIAALAGLVGEFRRDVPEQVAGCEEGGAALPGSRGGGGPASDCAPAEGRVPGQPRWVRTRGCAQAELGAPGLPARPPKQDCREKAPGLGGDALRRAGRGGRSRPRTQALPRFLRQPQGRVPLPTSPEGEPSPRPQGAGPRCSVIRARDSESRVLEETQSLESGVMTRTQGKSALLFPRGNHSPDDSPQGGSVPPPPDSTRTG